MPRYIQLPITKNMVDLLQLAVRYLTNRVPGWRVNEAELDYIMLQTNSMLAAELATIASDVPAAIFRWFGATMVNLPPEEATVASTTSTWQAIDDSGHTIDIGTVVGIESADGGLLTFSAANEVVIPPGMNVTEPGEVILVASEPGSASSGLGGPGVQAQLIDPLDWMDFILLNGMTIGGVDDELDDDYLDRLRAELQMMSPRPILANDFAVLARDVAGVYRATAIDGYQPMHNLLTANEASAETDATGWVGVIGGNVSSTGAQAADGAKSVQGTSTAGGSTDMGIRLVTGKPCTFGQQITAGFKARANTTVRSVRAVLQFYDGSGALIATGGIVNGTAANNSSSAWTDYTVSGLAPEGTATVKLGMYVVNPANGEIHYLDMAYLRKGSLVGFVAGGTTEYNQERMVTVAAQDSAGGAAGPQVKSELAAFLDAMREVNFIVNIVDPTFSDVNVLYEVQSLPEQDPVLLKSSIDSAITAFLDSTTWGLPDDGDPHVWVNNTKLRYTDLVHIVRGVSGVGYIVTLNLALDPGVFSTADVNLPGVAPLPRLKGLFGTVD